MKDEARLMINLTWAYLESQIDLSFLPPALAEWIENLGLDIALDLFIDLTKNYTTPFIWQEMQVRAWRCALPC